MRLDLLFLRRVLPLLASCALLFAPAPVRAGDYDPYSFEVSETEAVWDEDSYVSDFVQIDITSQWYGHSDVYVCDIRISNTDCFRRGYGGDDWPKATERIASIAERSGAILAMTGDNGSYLNAGMVAGNGEILRDSVNTKRDLCVLYRNGVMRTFICSECDMSSLYKEFRADDGVWQVFLFGPALLDSAGHALSSFNSNVFPVNPRSVIGYYEPGHYCFVQVDGRGVSSALEKGKKCRGLDLDQLTAFMEELGCKAAYNLDGGQSSALWFNGEIISTPYNGGRKVVDIVYIADLPPRNVLSVIQ